jgi:peptidoglycan/LPS O-acetylase OafA/YrhL
MAVHVPALDGVRGLAVLLVMQVHFWGLPFLLFGQQPTLAVDKELIKLAHTGWISFELFFVLSGFLITGILLDSKNGPGYFRNFYVRRLLRIFPLYYGFLAFVLLALPHLPWNEMGSVTELRQTQGWYWSYSSNIAAGISSLDTHLPIVHAHLWSLAVEEQFYMIWPAFVLLLSRRRLFYACLALMVFAPLFRLLLVSDLASGWANINAAQVLMPARIDELALGGLIALVARGYGDLRAYARWAPHLMAVSILGLVVLYFTRGASYGIDPWIQTVGYVAASGLAASILVMLITAPAGAFSLRIFTTPLLQLFGRWAYGLYVFQLLVAFTLAYQFQVHHLARLSHGSQIPVSFAFSIIATLATLALAGLSWTLFESRVLKLKKYVPYGRPGERRAAPKPQPVPVEQPATATPEIAG